MTANGLPWMCRLRGYGYQITSYYAPSERLIAYAIAAVDMYMELSIRYVSMASEYERGCAEMRRVLRAVDLSYARAHIMLDNLLRKRDIKPNDRQVIDALRSLLDGERA